MSEKMFRFVNYFVPLLLVSVIVFGSVLAFGLVTFGFNIGSALILGFGSVSVMALVFCVLVFYSLKLEPIHQKIHQKKVVENNG